MDEQQTRTHNSPHTTSESEENQTRSVAILEKELLRSKWEAANIYPELQLERTHNTRLNTRLMV
jgi:hypothetical protein